MSFVCHKCKQPLQLDASLEDLSPSAYDMIASSLPPAHAVQSRTTLKSEKLAQLPSPSAVKTAWQRSARSNPSSPSTMSPRSQGGTTGGGAGGSAGGGAGSSGKTSHPQRPAVLPNESFVLLQDSSYGGMPSPAPTKKLTPAPKFRQNDQSARPPSPPEEANQPNPSPLSHHLRSTLRLFNLLSSRTDLDHPLCAECTDNLLGELTRQLEETKKTRDGYIAFEKEVRKEKERERDGPSKGEVDSKIEKLKEEEHIAVEQLKAAEKENAELQEELSALELEEKTLEEEETEFWRAHNAHLLKAAEQESQLASLRAAYAADYATLELLERTNVYNDAFCIGHDGVFGTINGLRLGRVPSVPVEWAEINAAWGQTLLLLYTIARKLEYTFEGYKLMPMGSFSRIERTTPSDKATYELYGSGDLHLGRLLHNRRFDLAMVSFLDCLKQLVDYVRSQDPHVEFPHQIVRDKIGEASVKLQFNQEEAWTRALRHVLLALKILLKWTTNGSNG